MYRRFIFRGQNSTPCSLSIHFLKHTHSVMFTEHSFFEDDSEHHVYRGFIFRGKKTSPFVPSIHFVKQTQHAMCTQHYLSRTTLNTMYTESSFGEDMYKTKHHVYWAFSFFEAGTQRHVYLAFIFSRTTLNMDTMCSESSFFDDKNQHSVCIHF